jgi:glycine betaine/proline transport system substrate-binding protein
LSLVVGTGVAVADTIVLGTMNWAYIQVMANVLKTIIEENYGSEVEFVPGKHAVFFAAMDRGQGEVDVFPDLWLPNNQGMVDEYVTGKGSVAMTQPTFKGGDAFCTTKYTQETYGLNTVYDLTKPEIAKQTDTNGDGLGEIWLGGPGWTSTAYHKVRARDYGFADLYELQEYEEALVLANIEVAEKANKAIVFACYSPHHLFGKHVVLEEPAHDPEKWKPVHPSDDSDWYEKSYLATSFPPSESHIAYSKRLETTAPEVVSFLNRVDFGTELINEWSYEIDVNKRDPVEYAKQWIAAHPDKVNAWLGR